MLLSNLLSIPGKQLVDILIDKEKISSVSEHKDLTEDIANMPGITLSILIASLN
jgi:hypothetical protein